MTTLDDRKYTKTHEWVKIEDDQVIIGISDHAQEALGDITFIELPVVGEPVDRGGECGVIESVKAASDLFAPLSGEIADVNADLEDHPEAVNDSPYEDGWLYRITNYDVAEYNELMDADQYEATLEPNE